VGILRLALADTGREPDAPDLAAGRVVGDHEILDRIGRGGMGVVYRARQRSLGRVVALKMIRSGEFASEQERQRFRREAKAVGRLDHPNIVPIFEAGEHDGQPFFTMPLIAGGALPGQSRALDRAATGTGGGSRWQAAARLIARASRAVHHAHQRGIVHRDLKPSNLLIDAQGEPHLTDFGLAKLLEGDGNVSQSAAVLGTPGYMSPGQAAGRNRELTTSVDIYGLGAILYELITGRPPFTGDSTMEVLRKIVEELEEQVKSNRMDTIGFEPTPTRLNFTPEMEKALAPSTARCCSCAPRPTTSAAARCSPKAWCLSLSAPGRRRPDSKWPRPPEPPFTTPCSAVRQPRTPSSCKCFSCIRRLGSCCGSDKR
jgi:serine/threonine protein kinase